MATGTIYLSIGSAVGFRRVGGGNSPSPIVGPGVTQQTVYDLNGNSYAFTQDTFPILWIPPLDNFETYPGGISARQEVRFYNTGSNTLTITSASDILFYSNGVRASWTTTNSYPINISAGSYSTGTLAYRGLTPGEFSSSFIVKSNNYSQDYRVFTTQLVQNTSYITISPTITTATVVQPGQAIDSVFIVTPYFNNVVRTDLTPTLSVSFNNAGWTVVSAENNKIVTRFDGNLVSNINGTYTSTMVVSASFEQGTVISSTTATTIGIVNIDNSKFYNLGYWISPASAYNSIIGVSYDVINNIRFLTVGVGTGGSGIPRYSSGGAPYARPIGLGLYAGEDAVRSDAYFGWANVWRFPCGSVSNSEAPAIFYSDATGDLNNYLYKKKVTETDNYSFYFGKETSFGSMFIVEHDGEGNVSISINQLRTTSGDSEFDATLLNLTRAFYYYSLADVPARYTGPNGQPVNNYLPDPLVENQTQVFNGFRYNRDTGTAIVNTYLALYPR